MKSILITGGTGFIGTNLCLHLVKEGHFVIVIDKQHSSHSFELQQQYPKNMLIIIKDIIEPLDDAWFAAHQIDEIYHLACPTGVPNVEILAEEMLLTCSIGTRNILELAKKFHAKFLFASSSEVYGDPEVFPQTEEYTGNVSPTGIRSSYEEGKRFGESLVSMYVRKYGVHGAIVRIFNTYGPYMSSFDTRVIPKFVTLLKENKPLTIIGDGSNKRTFCYIDDLVSGLVMIQNKGEKGDVYNLGSDEEISIKDLADKLLVLTKRDYGVSFIDSHIEDHHRRLPALDKVHRLGWKQKISLDEGLRRVIEWYGL